MYTKGLSEDGNTLTLTKFSGAFKLANDPSDEWLALNHAEIRTGLAVDVETTGFDHTTDKIIEIGVRQFKFDRRTGHIVKMGEAYSGFQDPGEPLTEAIKKVTGLSDEILKSKKIDWDQVSKLFETSDIVIAHNAAFDRSFIEQMISTSAQKIWACSCYQMDWLSKGFVGKSLVLLGIYHGFFYESHRALNDVDALLHLLTLEDRVTAKPYLYELLGEAKVPLVQINAMSSPFERKNLLKKRGYRWNEVSKVWFCIIKDSLKEEEIKWLEEKVYQRAFPGLVREIRRCDNFKVLS